MLRKASPLFSADRIRIPMLIAQGANDSRVTQIESEQIVAAIEKNSDLVTYVLYPDEGHGFVRPPNILDFTAWIEKFLAEHQRAVRADGRGADRGFFGSSQGDRLRVKALTRD
jgi:dipeptidyl aminopeptidase/acylaminoacyl peptidase